MTRWCAPAPTRETIETAHAVESLLGTMLPDIPLDDPDRWRWELIYGWARDRASYLSSDAASSSAGPDSSSRTAS